MHQFHGKGLVGEVANDTDGSAFPPFYRELAMSSGRRVEYAGARALSLLDASMEPEVVSNVPKSRRRMSLRTRRFS